MAYGAFLPTALILIPLSLQTQLVKECVFAIMGAAETFQPPSVPQPAHPPPDPAAPAPAPTPHPPALGAADPSGLPRTFAHALALLINHHSATNVDSPALEPLAAHPAYQHLTGIQVGARRCSCDNLCQAEPALDCAWVTSIKNQKCVQDSLVPPSSLGWCV